MQVIFSCDLAVLWYVSSAQLPWVCSSSIYYMRVFYKTFFSREANERQLWSFGRYHGRWLSAYCAIILAWSSEEVVYLRGASVGWFWRAFGSCVVFASTWRRIINRCSLQVWIVVLSDSSIMEAFALVGCMKIVPCFISRKILAI